MSETDGIDEIAPLTEEQWEQLISWHRKRGKWWHVQGLQAAKQFSDTIDRIIAHAGTAQRDLEAVSNGIAAMAQEVNGDKE